MDEKYQPPQHYSYRDELVWLIQQLRNDISEAPDAWAAGPDLAVMPVLALELYLEAMKVEHRVEMQRRTYPPKVEWNNVREDLPPRPPHTSPYSGDDIDKRSG